MPKRTFTQVEPSSPLQSSSSPLKRTHTSTPASRSTASSAFSTPYTPSVYSTPADSPTNPLGLKRRVNNLTLPKATPFSKHIALRFQLVGPVDAPPPKPSLWSTPPDSPPSAGAVISKNPAAAEYARQGTYRIVQVPLSYTFRHLRALVLFLFSGDPAAPPRVPGHLFAVHHGILTSALGEITRSRVRVKLSRARDPYYSSRSLADLIATADAQGQGEEDLEDEEEDASWRWEGEDDFTIGHVWEVRSRDPKRGIIYHHDDTTAIHITVNAQAVPHRKGVGNMPFVFRAYGAVHLDPPRPRTPPESGSSPTPLPTPALPAPRIFPSYKRSASSATVQHAKPTASVASGSRTTRRSDEPGKTDIDDASSSDEDDFDGGLNTRVWNHTGAFPRFLSLVRARAPSSSASSSASPSPSVPPSPSSPVRPPSMSSSPVRGMRRTTTTPYANASRQLPSSGASSSGGTSLSLPVPAGSSASWDAHTHAPDASSPSPARSLPSLTPAPARVKTRYRVARAARRLLVLTERGLESAAAEEGDAEGRVQGQGSKKGFKGDGRKGKGRVEKDRRAARTQKGAVEGSEVWNPFAHLKNAS